MGAGRWLGRLLGWNERACVARVQSCGSGYAAVRAVPLRPLTCVATLVVTAGQPLRPDPALASLVIVVGRFGWGDAVGLRVQGGGSS